jgi:steroid 5-alpha reductase family enzyme
MAIALVVSAVGFYRVVYFISVGYAFSIVGMAAALVVAQWAGLRLASLVQIALLLAWGLRLGIYLVRREWQASYRATAESMHGMSSGLGLLVKVAIWVGVSVLYVALFAPALFAAMSGAPPAWAAATQWLGLLIMAGGLLIETVGDRQKSAAKALDAGRFVDSGLYARVRFPSYLGEITFWVGNFVAGFGFYAGFAHWLLAALGLVCLVLIMLGSTKRLEAAQDARYGSDDAYRAYVASTPILLPMVPIYSFRKLRVYLG